MSGNHIPEKYIDDYLKETEAPFTKQEFYNSVQHLVPLTYGEDNRVIGFIGLDIFPSQYLKENVPVLKIMYIDPPERRPTVFRESVRIVFNALKKQGFRRVEIHANKKINNWLRRELHSKPYHYIHLQDIDFYCDQMNKDIEGD